MGNSYCIGHMTPRRDIAPPQPRLGDNSRDIGDHRVRREEERPEEGTDGDLREERCKRPGNIRIRVEGGMLVCRRCGDSPTRK